MNTFIAIYKRPSVSIDIEKFTDFLVELPKETNIWKSKDANALIISYRVNPQTKTIDYISDEDSALTFEGFPLLEDHTFNPNNHLINLFENAKQNGSCFFEMIKGEYCAATYANNELHIGANLGGTHGLYYSITDDLVAFTNRSPLLLQLPGVSDKLDTQSSAWKCYQGYISNGRTPYEAIKKSPIGSVFSIDSALNIREKKTTYGDLKQSATLDSFKLKPLQAYKNQFDNISDYMHKFKQYYGDLKFEVPLSGGKDSRLILAFLLKAGLRDDIDNIWTRGPLYSPEVIASQEVCKQLKLPAPEIRRPKMISTSEISAERMLNSLNNLESNLSLYDFIGIKNLPQITMQGHQIALRDGAFTKCRTDSETNYLKDAIASRMQDGLKVLNEDYFKKTQNEFKDIFLSFHHSENAPLEDLGDLYYLHDRLLSWASPYCNTQYYSGPMSNPLLLGELFKFSFSIPYELRSHEVFHYLGIKHCAPEALNVPFADQQWNNNLGNILSKYGIQNNFTPIPPYKSHKSFPNIAHPFVSSIKVNYFNSLKKTMTDLSKKHRADLNEFMDVEAFTSQINAIDKPSFRELYCGMGVYSDLILREYGSDIFNNKVRPDIIKDLDNRINSSVSIAVSKNNPEKETSDMDDYENNIRRHEECIANLVKENQEAKALLANSPKMENTVKKAPMN